MTGNFHDTEILCERDRYAAARIPRMALTEFLRTGKRIGDGALDLPEMGKLYEPLGTFVSLRHGKQLRGCVGHIVPLGPLWEEIRNVAISAATADSRFRAVREDELSALSISITILSPMRPVDDPHEFEVGRHGILMEEGRHRSLFLPQVAPEWGWDKIRTFQELSRKAGLAPDGWKSPSVSFSLFEGQVFYE